MDNLICYNNNIGVSKNNSVAFEWYKKAADRGNVKSQSSVGWCYLNGIGVKKDDKEGIKWCQRAIDQGSVASEYYLGREY